MSERCEACNQEIELVMGQNILVTDNDDVLFFCDDCGVKSEEIADDKYETIPLDSFEWEFLD